MTHPQKTDAQSFFEFLAELERLVATFQGHMQQARAVVHARHENRGIVARAMGYTEPPNMAAPLRLVDPDEPFEADKCEEAHQIVLPRVEIDPSHKETIERLRDTNPDYC